MTYILARKIGMTQIFQDDGKVIPLTMLEAGPITVTQIKDKEKNGYEAVQVGFGNKRRLSKAQKGHTKGLSDVSYLREFKFDENLKRGDVIDVSVFELGQKVKVSTISKGRGFQGAVKRHGFHGMPASHGHHHVLRHVGSIGQRFPQHTLRGTRMAGRMGGVRVTTRGLKVVMIDKTKNLIGLKGAVPGRRGSLVEIVSI